MNEQPETASNTSSKENTSSPDTRPAIPGTSTHSMLTRSFRLNPMAWLACAFSAGIFLDTTIAPPVPGIVALLLAGVAGLVSYVILNHKSAPPPLSPTPIPLSSSRETVALVAVCLTFAAIGSLTHALRVRILPDDHVSNVIATLPHSTGNAIESAISGVITRSDRPLTIRERERSRFTQSIEIRLNTLDGIPASGRLPATVLLTDSTSDSLIGNLQTGDTIHAARARISPISPPPSPGMFDAKKYYRRRGITHRCLIEASSITRVTPYHGWNPGILMARYRNRLARDAAESMRADDAGLFSAFILGYRGDIAYRDRNVFRATGTAHLLAISGLHLHLFALMIWLIGSRMMIPRRKLAALVLAITIPYAALTGFNLPVTRAVIMQGAFLGAIMLRRETTAANVIGLAALIILAISPSQLFQAGFQLSFAAVTGIMFLSPVWHTLLWGKRNYIPETDSAGIRIWYGFTRTFSVSLSAWLATAPLTWVHFGSISPFAPITNILIIPAMLAAQILGLIWLLAMILLPAPPPIHLSAIASLGVWTLRVWLEWLGVIFTSRLNGATGSAWMGFAVALPVLTAVTLNKRIKRVTAGILQAGTGACMIAVLAYTPKPSDPGAIHIFNPDRRPSVIRIDAHGGATVTDPDNRRQGMQIADYLSANSARVIDTIVLTQPKGYSGAAVLTESFTVRHVILPPAGRVYAGDRQALIARLKYKRIDYRILNAGGSASFGDVTISRKNVFWENSGANEARTPYSGNAVYIRIAFPDCEVTTLFADRNATPPYIQSAVEPGVLIRYNLGRGKSSTLRKIDIIGKDGARDTIIPRYSPERVEPVRVVTRRSDGRIVY